MYLSPSSYRDISSFHDQSFPGSKARSKRTEPRTKVAATEAKITATEALQPTTTTTNCIATHNAKDKILHFDGACTCGRFRWVQSTVSIRQRKTHNGTQVHWNWLTITINFYCRNPASSNLMCLAFIPFMKSLICRFQARQSERGIKRAHLSPQLLKAKYVHLVCILCTLYGYPSHKHIFAGDAAEMRWASVRRYWGVRARASHAGWRVFPAHRLPSLWFVVSACIMVIQIGRSRIEMESQKHAILCLSEGHSSVRCWQVETPAHRRPLPRDPRPTSVYQWSMCDNRKKTGLMELFRVLWRQWNHVRHSA